MSEIGGGLGVRRAVGKKGVFHGVGEKAGLGIEKVLVDRQ